MHAARILDVIITFEASTHSNYTVDLRYRAIPRNAKNAAAETERYIN